jgi:hypothetical protein
LMFRSSWKSLSSQETTVQKYSDLLRLINSV